MAAPVEKSRPKSNGVGRLRDHPEDRGRGPKKGAPNAGRPKRVNGLNLRDLMQHALHTRLHVLTSIADGDPVEKVKLGKGDKAVEATVSATPGDRVRALDLLAKYGLGPPAQEIALSGSGDKPITVRFVHEAKPR